MSCGIPTEVHAYFSEHSPSWREHFHDVSDFETARQRLLELSHRDPHLVNEIMGTAIGYVHEAVARMGIYQEALNKLSAGVPPNEVDQQLNNVGFRLEHNQLGRAITRAIGNISQNVMQVIQNFINTVSQSFAALQTMKLSEVSFHIGASPAVDLKFA